MSNFKSCPACKNDVTAADEICDVCQFPFNGSEKEKSIHIGRFISQKGVIVDSQDSLTKSQYLLYLAAGMYTLSVVINLSLLLNNLFTLIFNAAIILVLIVSGILVKKAPIVFLLVPLFVLLSIYISNYVIDPSTLHQGIAFKLIILGSLIYSIYNYARSESFKKKFNVE